MESGRKKELAAEYRQRKKTGCVFSVTNRANGKVLVLCDMDLKGSRNRFDFMRQTGSCYHMRLQEDWRRFGADSFEYALLDGLEQKETQTPAEFKEELETLRGLREQQVPAEKRY